jgi:Na+-driven multidrug efflux pump
VQVGQNVGAGDQEGTNSAARVAIVRGAIAVGVNALVFGASWSHWFPYDPVRDVHVDP